MRKRSAFTLIELLVVVAIIVILVAILLPSLGNARAQAQNVKCLTTLKSLQAANDIYADEFSNHYVPWHTGDVGSTVSSPGPTGQRWDGNRHYREILRLSTFSVAPLAVPRNMICPLATYALNNTYAGAPDGYAYYLGRSYSYNIESAPSNAWSANHVGFKRTQVVAPAARFMFAEGTNFWTNAWNSSNPGYTGESFTGNPSTVALRHSNNTTANVAFLDGHAESIKAKDINYMYTGVNLYNRVIPLWRIMSEQ